MNSLMTMLFFALTTLLALATALPVYVRDVFVPPVTYPHTGTVWFVGQKHNVTWDISGAPSQITNPIGSIVLAHNGLLNLTHPLASNFSILAGRHEITVPDVSPDNSYTIVLFGDSGNDSQNFTISK
ncbi:hypothetical protein EUX98_g5971 [Antrodiella citrinella]|uniref:Uncharacterized protein n=1 Tax=Antrodiella citrinella TaxID=2447956 RepID=A0A4S4MQA7_9APHY|nr:hypothetical protein EUX98_g5971 [Antrodiella citrinella]